MAPGEPTSCALTAGPPASWAPRLERHPQLDSRRRDPGGHRRPTGAPLVQLLRARPDAGPPADVDVRDSPGREDPARLRSPRRTRSSLPRACITFYAFLGTVDLARTG